MHGYDRNLDAVFKVSSAIEAGLKVVLCIQEHERATLCSEDEPEDFLFAELERLSGQLSPEDWLNISIVYQPFRFANLDNDQEPQVVE